MCDLFRCPGGPRVGAPSRCPQFLWGEHKPAQGYCPAEQEERLWGQQAKGGFWGMSVLKMHFDISDRAKEAMQVQMCKRKKIRVLICFAHPTRRPEDMGKMDTCWLWTWVKNVILPVLLTTPASCSVHLAALATYLKIKKKTEHLNVIWGHGSLQDDIHRIWT